MNPSHMDINNPLWVNYWKAHVPGIELNNLFVTQYISSKKTYEQLHEYPFLFHWENWNSENVFHIYRKTVISKAYI